MYSHYNVLFVRLRLFGPNLYRSELSVCQTQARITNEQWGSLTFWGSWRHILKSQATWMEDVIVSVPETRKVCDSEGCGWGWRKREVRECEPEWWWVWREARFTLALLTPLTLHLIVLRLHSCVLLALSLPTPTACCILTLNPSLQRLGLGLNTSAASWLVKAKLLYSTKVCRKLRIGKFCMQLPGEMLKQHQICSCKVARSMP